MTQIRLFRNGIQEGPYNLEQIRSQIRAGILSLNDPAWVEGWPDWKSVNDLPGLLEGQPVPEKPKIDLLGSWCPHCGNRNSDRKTDGAGCLLMGILFISVLGILFIPFLPKSWHCRSCGNVWK
jgi:hypothetical protein